MTFSRLFEAVAHVDEIVRSSVAETRNGLLGARSSRLAPVVRFQTLARVLRHHSGKVVLPARTPCKRACATPAATHAATGTLKRGRLTSFSASYQVHVW